MKYTTVTLKFCEDGAVEAKVGELRYITMQSIRIAAIMIEREFRKKMEEANLKNFKPVERIKDPDKEALAQVSTEANKLIETTKEI